MCGEDTLTEKLRILVRYEHGYGQTPFGTSYIRVLLPLSHPVNAGVFDVVGGDQRIARGQIWWLSIAIGSPILHPNLPRSW